MVLRVNGFSGFDVDGTVTKLMQAKRVPLDKLNQQKTILNWQRDSYREVNSKLFDFKQNKLTDTFNKSMAMTTLQSTVTGNTAAIKAVATSSASTTPMTVTVEKLATKASIQPQGSITLGAKKASLSTKLNELNASIDDTMSLTINKKEIKIASTDTISTVISKINSSSAGVNASYNEVSGEFSISAKDFGNASIEIAQNYADSPLLQVLKLNPSSVTPAQDAEVSVTTESLNGTKVTEKFTSKTNALTVNGISMTLLSTNTAAEPSTITTTPDSTQAVDTIKSFVQSYNDLLNFLNTKVGEAKYRDFQPLTDAQKEAMKESDITAWEAKAKSGLLKNDGILNSAITSMRSLISGNMGQLSALGITTGEYSEGGKLYVDEDKLKNMLENNPQQVINLFQGNADSKSEGLFSKMSTAMTNTMQNLANRAGTNRFSGDLTGTFTPSSVMGRRLREFDAQILTLTTRLNDAETRYYKQFSAMETAINRLQSQSSSLFGASY
ncbi:flagellar filament capping protein FliD [Paenibacillus xylanexedens]|uniref:flagellar filament capping protein FliD n=1 Tax=Paenibacillus xylanexedens TaxID=528191 RepID=UPI00119E3B17|nr:flagellar filament capping protein FliD [Paenibacillus xylanexedens]